MSCAVVSVVFDHRHGGTAAAAWQDAGLARLPAVRAVAGRLVVLAAHPDDETLGAGGLIAAAARAGATVTVLIATDGAASHPDSPTYRPDELAALRRREVTAAVAHLAPRADLRLLDLPDGRLAEHAGALEDALDDALMTPSIALASPAGPRPARSCWPRRGAATATPTTRRVRWRRSVPPGGSTRSTGSSRSGPGTGATRTAPTCRGRACTACRSTPPTWRPNARRWPSTSASTARCPNGPATSRC